MPRGLRHIILFLTLLISAGMNYVSAVTMWTLIVQTSDKSQGLVGMAWGTSSHTNEEDYGAMFNEGRSVTLSAQPKTGYHFVRWQDNVTSNPRTVVTGNTDMTYTAYFAINQYTLTVKTATNNTTQGTVRFAGETAGASVSGTFNHGAGVNIIATPATGYHFVKWSDNNTNANRTVYVTAAATYTATFAINTYMLTANTATGDATQGTVTVTIIPAP